MTTDPTPAMLQILLPSLFLVAPPAPAPTAPQETPAGEAGPAEGVHVVRDWLVVEPVDARGRRPVRPDVVFLRHLFGRHAEPPHEGERFRGEKGEKTWRRVEAEESGAVNGDLGWAYAAVEWDRDEVVMAKLSGAWTLFVNRAGFCGDAYGYGFGGFPIELHAGINHLFVTGIRGGFSVELSRIEHENKCFVGDWDVTRPDLELGGESEVSCELALPVVNAGTSEVNPTLLLRRGEEAPEAAKAPSPPLTPGECALEPPSDQAPSEDGGIVRDPASAGQRDGTAGEKVEPFEFPLPPVSIAKALLHCEWSRDELEDPRLFVEVFRPSSWGTDHTTMWPSSRVLSKGPAPVRAELTFTTYPPGAPRVSTFVSAIDGSVQEYGLRPATEAASDERSTGLVLTCHGAGVKCRGQMNAYGSYEDLWIAVPTNRRPFGFDWQDQGRTDAYEVLERALALSGADPNRVYVTGHSMGGHGAWHLAANDPDRWAAVAPSAGWASFDTYGGRPEGELSDYWHAADGTSLTFSLVENLAQLPTYVLHGEKDDNVPPSEARAMIAALEAAGATPESHFEEGAGHWWDGDAAPGADCVTWPGIFELFERSRRDPAPLEAHFTSVDPAVDADHEFVHVEQPMEYGAPFSVAARYDVEARTLTVATENVRTFHVDLPWETTPERIVVDGVEHEAGTSPGRRYFSMCIRGWQMTTVATPLAPAEKSPERSGPFKRAFDRRFLLVYGTAGDSAMDRELLERARYDGAEWLYRANASVPVISDETFLAAPPERLAGRNVILYGNRDTNRAWEALLPEDAPVRAGAGWIEVGETRWEGDDLLCLFLYPRRGDDRALVGAFASSGLRGARLGYTSGKFVSGVGLPDLLLCDQQVLVEGDGGVLAAGWFDHRWSWSGGFALRGGASIEER